MTEMDGDIAGVNSRAPVSRHWACAGLISAVTFGVFWPVRSFEFLNFDDDHYVTENPFVRSGLSWDNVCSAFSQSRGGHYHPLTWISHMLDVSLFGLEPGPAHLVNALLHALTAGLTFAFALRCLSRTNDGSAANRHRLGLAWAAASVALIYALHPLRVESVAWLAERKDVLSANFALLTLHAWLGYQRRASLLRYGLVVVLFGLGLLCKPTVVMLPVLLVALDLWLAPHRFASHKHPYLQLLVEKAPLGGLAVASVVMTALSQRQDGAMQKVALDLLGDRITTAFVAYLAYFGKLFWPAGLGAFYPWVAHPPGIGVGAVCGVAALSWIAWNNRRRAPALAFGWTWFVIAPLPIIGFVQFGGQAFADRWTYLSHLGLILGLIATLRERLARAQLLTCMGIAVCMLTLLTRMNLPHWRDSEALFRHTLRVAPNNFLAHTNLGNALDAKGNLSEATTHYEAAVHFNPTYPEAQNNLGTARARTGRFAEAEQSFVRALELRPSLLLARYNLGLVRSQLGRQLEAASTWLELLDREPNDPKTRASLTAIVERFLLPACRAGRLDASTSVRDTFTRQVQRWQPSDDIGELAGALRALSVCVASR